MSYVEASLVIAFRSKQRVNAPCYARAISEGKQPFCSQKMAFSVERNSCQDFLNHLQGERQFFRDGYKQSLDGMEALLAALGNPDRSFEYRVIVGGTAGKGTVTRLIEDTLLREGRTVTTITSPHIQIEQERIRRNGRLIGAGDFEEAVLAVQDAARKVNTQPTYYEALVLAGIVAGAKAGTQYLVAEIGLGGRLDAVNAVQGTRVCALTNIGADHLHTLGGTLEAVAHEKAGIFTSDTRAAFSTEKVYRDILQTHCPIPIQFFSGIPEKLNKKIARNVCEFLLGHGDFEMRKINIPARYEAIGNIILDGAHCAPKIEYLMRKLNKESGQIHGVLALTKDRDMEVLRPIIELCDQVFYTKPNHGRDFHSPLSLQRHYKKGEVFDDAYEALGRAQALPGKVLVTGSFYLCGEIRNHFYDPEKMLQQQTEFPE